MNEQQLREAIVQVGRQLYARDYITGSAGNISARLDEARLLTTPSGVNKGALTPEQLVITDLEGSCLSALPGMRPTSELPMHTEVYRQRPDVQAVVHAHPVTCVGLTLAGITLEEPLIPEAVVFLGPVPTTPYATPSSTENRDAIAGLIRTHDAILLAHHGSLTVGRTLEEAFARLEILEHTARSVAIAWQLGGPRPLPPGALEKLQAIRKNLGSPA